jgi:hypothetical protein
MFDSLVTKACTYANSDLDPMKDPLLYFPLKRMIYWVLLWMQIWACAWEVYTYFTLNSYLQLKNSSQVYFYINVLLNWGIALDIFIWGLWIATGILAHITLKLNIYEIHLAFSISQVFINLWLVYIHFGFCITFGLKLLSYLCLNNLISSTYSGIVWKLFNLHSDPETRQRLISEFNQLRADTYSHSQTTNLGPLYFVNNS